MFCPCAVVLGNQFALVSICCQINDGVYLSGAFRYVIHFVLILDFCLFIEIRDMAKRKTTNFIAIHCSATPSNDDIGVKELRDLHVHINGWRDVGYNLVIRRDGTIQKGRALDEMGAHVKGFNDVSIGICLIGGVDNTGEPQNNFTPVQMIALKAAIEICTGLYPDAQVQGHRDFPGVNKACPCFDVGGWWAGVKEWAQC